ncbi:MAG: hypothetical protein ACI9QQ_002156 [Myxococcota bacterium]
MTERPSIIGMLAPILATYPPEEQRIFAALGERIAASRYRAWAEQGKDDATRDALLACAAREEDIASRVESLHPRGTEVRERLLLNHAGLPEQYVAMFEGFPLTEQFAMQAEAERAGAAAWRAFAGATEDAAESQALLACAPLEEQNAATLDELIAALNASP